jgi:transcriptional regulator with XRE-family HTH domain
MTKDARALLREHATETFADALRAIRIDEGCTQAEFAKLLEVSTKTISRWELGVTVPNEFQAHGVVEAITLLYPQFRARFAVALHVAVDMPQPPPPPNMAILKAALDGALFEATEILGVPPQKVREAVALVLERVALIGVDAQTAAKMVTGQA